MSLSPKSTNRHRPQRVFRLVVGAVLSFTMAIALPFIAPRALFPASMDVSQDSAPVVVDGRSIFRVTDTATTASAAARAQTISSRLQEFAQRKLTPEIKVEAADPENLATVWLSAPISEAPEAAMASEPTDAPDATDIPKELKADFTVTQGDTSSALTPAAQAEAWSQTLQETFEQSQRQRQSTYIRQNLWQIPAIPVVAALAHWLAGLLWRDYLAQFLRSAAMDREDTSQGKRDREQFTTVSLFLNSTLLLLRLGIWIGALLYATNLFPDTRQVSYRIISQLTKTFTQKTVPLGNVPISILDIFRVLVLVMLVTLAARIVSNLIKQRVLQETGINRGVQEAISILLRYGLIFIGSIVVLQASGIDLSSLTLLASALGVGAGLGLQNIVKDIGSGLVLVFERPIQVGEFVQIGEQTGTVERIGARSAEIRTLDQVSIIVPNSQFLENKVVNWSHRNPISRIRIPVGVDYSSDPEIVKDLLLRTGYEHPDVLKAPPSIVLFKDFGDSALQFDLLVWVSQPSRQYIIKSDLLFRLSKALKKEGISIPYPQRDIHVVMKDAQNLPMPKQN